MANPNLKAGPGRPKGLKNKVTRDVKEMILGALAAKGGQEWLEAQMDSNPTAFMTLLGKVLPTQIQGDADNPIKTVSEVLYKTV
jgi:hypothetical protein